MDVRPYIIGGTFIALIAAVIWFFVSLRRARAASLAARLDAQHLQAAAALTPSAELDTSLEGLSVEVSPDAVSASLLTPLKEVEWEPPQQPAPIEELHDASLDGRIADFKAAPAVPEPAFSVEAYSPWEVADGTELPIEEPWAPEPEPPAVTPEWKAAVPVVGTEPSDEVDDDEFAAELAELMPTTVLPIVPVSMPVPEEPVVEPAPEPVIEPEPVPVIEPEAAYEPAAVPVMSTEQAFEVEHEPEFEPLEIQLPEPAPVDELVALGVELTPVPVPAPAEPEPVPVPAEPEPEPAQPAGDWEGLLREHQGLPTVTDRPEVKVTTAEPPQPAPAPVPVAPARPPRPRVVVAGVVIEAPEPDAQPVTRVRPEVPELVMAAPVEMWFGDSRVGVKAGTATYDRFRKYADVLFEDLKASQSGTR